MTQPSRRFDLWRRMYSRFLIEPLPAQQTESPRVATLIQPVTDADELLVVRRVARQTIVTSAAQEEVIYTVPDNRRAKLRGVWALLSTGTYTFDSWLISDGTSSMRLRLMSSVTEDVSQFEGQELKLDSGWTVSLNLDAHSGAGNLVVAALVEEEDTF